MELYKLKFSIGHLKLMLLGVIISIGCKPQKSTVTKWTKINIHKVSSMEELNKFIIKEDTNSLMLYFINLSNFRETFNYNSARIDSFIKNQYQLTVYKKNKYYKIVSDSFELISH